RTGGSGVVGHQAIASSAPDGYTLGLITVEITMMHHVGLTPLKHTDYTPIGLVNADPAGVNVRVDSPYKSVKDLLQAIKANPGKMKASRTRESIRTRCRGCRRTAPRPGCRTWSPAASTWCPAPFPKHAR